MTGLVADTLQGWVDQERGRFALWLPVAMSAGAVWYFELRMEPPVWLGAGLAGFGAALLLLLRRFFLLRALCSLMLATALGFTAAGVATANAPETIEVPRRAVMVSGVVREVERLPPEKNDGRRIVLEQVHFADGPALPRTARIRLRANDETPLDVGDHIRLRALLSRPAPPAYPGGWDLQREAYFSGIGAVGFALNPLEVVEKAPPQTLSGLLRGARETVASRICAGLAGSEGAIATTLLTGITLGIPAEDRAAFRDSGLAHLLAIAGLHIGIVMGLVFGSVRVSLACWEYAALRLPVKAIAAVTALLAGGAYMLFTGAHVPIIRSFSMACLVTLGILVGRRTMSLRGLGLAMGILVLIAPVEVVGVSFQMSFSAVLALIVGYAMLQSRLAALHGDGGGVRRVLSHVVALALTSALAGTFSAPYAAYHFGQIQLYYVVANMAAVPITAFLVMPAGLLALMLMPLHLEYLALIPMGWGVSAIIWIGRSVSAWPDATLGVPHLAPWGLAVFSLGLAWLGIWRSRLRLAGLAAMAVGLASPIWMAPPDVLISADARLIGYRQGDAMLLQKTSGGSAFTEESWRSYWNVTHTSALDCPAENCFLQPRPGAPGAVLLRGAGTDAVCTASLLISAEPIRLSCQPRIPFIDRFSVWRNGAYAAWLGETPRIVSDRELRGERPWVLGLPLAGRVPANTSPALQDE